MICDLCGQNPHLKTVKIKEYDYNLCRECLRRNTIVNKEKRQKPNLLCACGSNKKYKRCCQLTKG